MQYLKPPIFTARRYASVVYDVIVCLSVRMSVRSSQVDIEYYTKMTQPRITKTTPSDYSFLVPKILAKFQRRRHAEVG